MFYKLSFAQHMFFPRQHRNKYRCEAFNAPFQMTFQGHERFLILRNFGTQAGILVTSQIMSIGQLYSFFHVELHCVSVFYCGCFKLEPCPVAISHEKRYVLII